MGAVRKKTAKDRACCPVCLEIVGEASFPYCQACGIVIWCPSCRKPVEKTAKVCPDCGATIPAARK